MGASDDGTALTGPGPAPVPGAKSPSKAIAAHTLAHCINSDLKSPKTIQHFDTNEMNGMWDIMRQGATRQARYLLPPVGSNHRSEFVALVLSLPDHHQAASCVSRQHVTVQGRSSTSWAARSRERRCPTWPCSPAWSPATSSASWSCSERRLARPPPLPPTVFHVL